LQRERFRLERDDGHHLDFAGLCSFRAKCHLTVTGRHPKQRGETYGSNGGKSQPPPGHIGIKTVLSEVLYPYHTCVIHIIFLGASKGDPITSCLLGAAPSPHQAQGIANGKQPVRQIKPRAN